MNITVNDRDHAEIRRQLGADLADYRFEIAVLNRVVQEQAAGGGGGGSTPARRLALLGYG